MPAAPPSDAIIALIPVGVDRTTSLHRLEQSLACWSGRRPGVVVIEARALQDVGPAAVPESAGLVVLACDAPEQAAPMVRRLVASGRDRPPPIILHRGSAPSRTDLERITLSWDDPPALLTGVLMGAMHAATALAHRASDHDLTARTAATVARELERQQDELHLAVQVQRALLPAELPRHDRGRFAVIYRPGTSLSGDTYDAQRLDEHHVGLFIADACGHGIAAALLMTLVCRMLAWRDHGQPTPHGADPARIIARLNTALCSRRDGMLSPVSAACAVIDTRDGTGRAAVAGHPPPIIAGRSSDADEGVSVRLLSGGGPLLGVLEEAVYENVRIRLAPGDTFILHTDGFEHVFPPAAPAADMGPSRRRLPDAVAAEHLRVLSRLGDPGTALEQAVRDLEDEMLGRRGSLHQVDDVTLLAFRYRAEPCPEPSGASRVGRGSA
jgi:serine phosphatase RsbU (regulator of sigma subunit)